MNRLLISLFLAAGLAGCGFHLRNSLALPANTPAVLVTSTTPYSELSKLLERQLQASDVKVAEPVKLAPGEKAPEVARLEVLSERWGDQPIAIDGQGRAQEFRLRYAAIFRLLQADGTDLVPQQVIELSRDYVSPPEDATGTATEREILASELRRDMSSAILRRIDSVVRQRIATGTLDNPATPPAADAR